MSQAEPFSIIFVAGNSLGVFEVKALTAIFPSVLLLRCLLCSLRDDEEVTFCFSGSDYSIPRRKKKKKLVLTVIRLQMG